LFSYGSIGRAGPGFKVSVVEQVSNLLYNDVSERRLEEIESQDEFCAAAHRCLGRVLRSRTAARVNIEIMRVFVRLRRLLATPGELAQ
jgi:hypothetical protein